MGLTKSEQKIIEYMKQGLTFKQIARKMSLSVIEVSKEVNELYAKFNAYNRISFLEKVDIISSCLFQKQAYLLT